MSIRLVYAQSSSDLESHIEEFLSGGGGGAQIGVGAAAGGMIELSAPQLNRINGLHLRTLRDEERLTNRMATLQEDVADKPLLPIVMDRRGGGGGRSNGNGDGDREEVRAAMDEYVEKLGRMLEEADELRIRTVRELVTEILTPRQAVELLAAGKQLHLAIHAWGWNRDRERNG